MKCRVLISVFCAKNAELDNLPFVLEDCLDTDTAYDPGAVSGSSGYVAPNDNTDVLNNMAVSESYSITLKDGGKVLCR